MKPVAVAIMAKAPVAGAVKTRLTPPLTATAAAALYRCFLLDKIEQVRTLKGAQPVVAYAPARARSTFEMLAPDFALLPQDGPDLGARLANGLARKTEFRQDIELLELALGFLLSLGSQLARLLYPRVQLIERQFALFQSA